MKDVRGDLLGPPHGTTPAAVIANKKNDSLEAVNSLKALRKSFPEQFSVSEIPDSDLCLLVPS